MTLYEVVFKLTHNSRLCDISRKFRYIDLFVWCNEKYEIIEVITEKSEEYSMVVEAFSKIGKILEESSDQHGIHLIAKTRSFGIEDSVSKQIDELGLLLVPPVIYQRGWEYRRVIAFRHEDLNMLLQRLEDMGFVFEILRKVHFNGFVAGSLTLTADALFSNLTKKQIHALLTAYNCGYYRFPKRANVQNIAAKTDVPRTTFQEHLKKAENKIVTSVVPYLQLFEQALEKEESSKTR